MNNAEVRVVSDISVVFEDDDILVINKPSGITVNKADTTRYEKTVQEWAEEKIQIPQRTWVVPEGNDFVNRGGVVHRLDKETSGILLLAKNPESFSELQRQFKERIVKKTYRALAHGKVLPEEGIINVPVGRLPWNRRQFGVVAGGREAVTKYKSLEVFDHELHRQHEFLTFLELYPETGRTHQIRVHLKYLGHPIFADFLYAGRKTQRDDRKFLGRVFLHAAKLVFLHPRSQQEVTYESPLPEELQNTLTALKK